MKNWIKVLALLSLLPMFNALAVDKAAINKHFSMIGMAVNSIDKSPINGLLQVMTNRGLFYISEDGTYLVQGRMFNMTNGMRNETEGALSSVRLAGLNDFEGSMIEFPAKNEKYKVTVFTDITCGYCRKLHNQMDEYNELGITVRYLAFPRSGARGQTYHDMVSVWCAADPQEAMTEAKSSGDVTTKKCDTRVEDQYEFGQQVGVTGTPAIVMTDGTMMPGYQPPSQLLNALKNL